MPHCFRSRWLSCIHSHPIFHSSHAIIHVFLSPLPRRDITTTAQYWTVLAVRTEVMETSANLTQCPSDVRYSLQLLCHPEIWFVLSLLPLFLLEACTYTVAQKWGHSYAQWHSLQWSIMFSHCTSRANIGSPAGRSALAVGQHAVRVVESIPVPTWTRPQSGQVHYTDAATGASNDRGRSSAL